MNRKDSPAFQLYAADFYMDTITWTSEEVGCYFRLLMNEWVNGPFPFDAKKMQKVCQTSSKKWLNIWNVIATKFCLNDEGNLYNVRLEETRQEQHNYIKSQRESGLKGVEKKRNLGIYPFHQSTDPLSDPPSDPPSETQALHSSSSSSYNNKEGTYVPPSQEEINEASLKKINQDLNRITKELYERNIFPRAPTFKNTMLKAKANPRTVLHAFIRCFLKQSFNSENGAWAYCLKIIKVEDGNFNEREFRKTAIRDN